MEIENLRRNYQEGVLDELELRPNPFEQFRLWLETAQRTPSSEWFEVNAMTLATVGSDGMPAVRVVLLKKIDEQGFAFFTNYTSPKARQLEENPQAGLCFYWPHVEKQIRIGGRVEKTDASTSDAYFQGRPRASQIGAVVSPQSQPLASRQSLELAAANLERELNGAPVPRPETWGGYRLTPQSFEFWQGRPNRLHDRFLYERLGDGQWKLSRLAP